MIGPEVTARARVGPHRRDAVVPRRLQVSACAVARVRGVVVALALEVFVQAVRHGAELGGGAAGRKDWLAVRVGFREVGRSGEGEGEGEECGGDEDRCDVHFVAVGKWKVWLGNLLR